MKNSNWKIPFVFTYVLTPIAVFLAIISGGAGHGDYFSAKFLFPYTMATASVFDQIYIPFAILALFQFPIYGYILKKVNETNKIIKASLIILVLHFLMIAVVFSLPSSYFG